MFWELAERGIHLILHLQRCGAFGALKCVKSLEVIQSTRCHRPAGGGHRRGCDRCPQRHAQRRGHTYSLGVWSGDVQKPRGMTSRFAMCPELSSRKASSPLQQRLNDNATCWNVFCRWHVFHMFFICFHMFFICLHFFCCAFQGQRLHRPRPKASSRALHTWTRWKLGTWRTWRIWQLRIHLWIHLWIVWFSLISHHFVASFDGFRWLRR